MAPFGIFLLVRHPQSNKRFWGSLRPKLEALGASLRPALQLVRSKRGVSTDTNDGTSQPAITPWYVSGSRSAIECAGPCYPCRDFVPHSTLQHSGISNPPPHNEVLGCPLRTPAFARKGKPPGIHGYSPSGTSSVNPPAGLSGRESIASGGANLFVRIAESHGRMI